MGIESAMLLEEAAEELQKLIGSFPDMDQTMNRALGGDLLEAYQTLNEKTEDTVKSLRGQVLQLAEQSLMEV